MKRRLLWKLCIAVGLGTVSLFAVISWLVTNTEEGMSMLAQEHQQQILDYGAQAERLYLAGDEQALEHWLRELQQREHTWAAVVRSQITPLAGSVLTERFTEGFRLGRDVGWKIHLYFKANPIMEVPFAGGDTHFLMILPERMRPGAYWHYTRLLLQIGLPLALLLLLCWFLYRHVVDPLRALQRATEQISSGDFDVQVRASLGGRNDEISALADHFDRMAARTGHVITTLRQLMADLSHELRTPLARIDMAVHSLQQGLQPEASLQRIRREADLMRNLVEDSLALAWLENEHAQLRGETLDLVDLLDTVIDDAAFEFPDRRIVPQLPEEAPLAGSDHRALAQAIENLLRNALRHSPVDGCVRVTLVEQGGGYALAIDDQGPGVPDEHLEAIFQPFFRLPAAANDPDSEGFGIGLALARRQIEATGGQVRAENLPGGGLRVRVSLPHTA